MIVALKKMRFTLTEDGVPMAILREISLLKQLEKFDHPNIVRYVNLSLHTHTYIIRTPSSPGPGVEGTKKERKRAPGWEPNFGPQIQARDLW